MTVRAIRRADERHRCPWLQRGVLSMLLALATTGVASSVRAQEDSPISDLDMDPTLRFTAAAWSLVHPDRDYEGGCVVGFLAFKFSPTGYFVYNNKIRGSWRVDELGNLVLRTKDGFKFTLIVDGDTLHPMGELPFARRFYRYQRCPI